MSTTIYHPKGSMCSVCVCAHCDCSNLKFNKMNVIQQYSKSNDPTVFKVVKCSSFDRGDKELGND